MRWKFPDPDNAAEEKRKAATLQKIVAWWKAFESRSADIKALFRRQQNWDLADWMHQHFSAIDPRLMWEYGPGLTGGDRLVMTPESVRQLRPLVDVILQNAPALPGWEFYAYRLPEGEEMARETVKVRTGGDISRMRFKAERGNLNRIDIVFCSPDHAARNEKQVFNDCFVTCESMLGEEVLDKWIGSIEADKNAVMSKDFLPVGELLATVKALISQIVGSLPSKPCLLTTETATWSLYKLKPKTAEDYPEQLDMYVGRTMYPDMWMCTHNNQPFDSCRFSRHGEIFAHLKLDGSEGLDTEKFSDKAEIEEALDEVLVPEGLGAVIGGGTGNRYSYIDLALVDVKNGIEAIKARLREGNVPKRSWILFFDSDLRDEWIGIWNDTPPPPA